MDARFRKVFCCLTLGGHMMATTAHADGLIDRFKAGRHKQLKQEYHTKEVKDGPPWDLTQVASMVDVVEEGILDDGTVVIKRPDVWSQARMTKYRREFEQQMSAQLGNFDAVLSARIARTDQASTESATTLGAALQGSGGGGQKPAAIVAAPPASNQAELIKAQADATQAQANADTATAKLIDSQTEQAKVLAEQNVNQLKPITGGSNDFAQSDPFTLLGEKGAFQNFAKNVSEGQIGLEPTIYLDERKRYLDHLNQLRRVNLGDDNADSAGYSMTLVRLPVSIQPGAKTEKGHGALLNVTARPEFRPDFLPTTFRNLVVQDIVDQLTPVLYEILDRNLDGQYSEALEKARTKKDETTTEDINTKALELCRKKFMESDDRANTVKDLNKTRFAKIPSTRLAARPYPIAPSDISKVYLPDNLFQLSLALRQAIPTAHPRAADIRAYLYQISESAYKLTQAFEPMIGEITLAVNSHQFGGDDKNPRPELDHLFSRLTKTLPFDLARERDFHDDKNLLDPVAIMCWAIAVDAGQLDERLRDEMRRLDGQNGFHLACDPDSLLLYLSEPTPDACQAFQSYVNARWPIICFALDPVTDQQNIADATSMRRDLQIAMSFAFATGKINFNQFNRFRRRIELDAETIALNRTTTTFAHGNESFGWRFYPRYQNPPQESTNFNVIGNQLLRGGPGRDYQIKNSKLEAGQRELTAVIILPSFLPRVRFEVVGNWFKLTQPDDLTVPTARMVWQGQEVMKVREAVTKYCDPRLSRPGDLERVLVKLDRVEQMLPMQTESVSIPYQNTQGGFDLFTPGLSSLVPELYGYEGVDEVELGKSPSFLVFGKNLSIHETKVVAGGQPLPDAAVEILSREVMRLTVPAGLLPTELADRSDRPYMEVVAGTPNGISNRLVVPIKPPAKPAVPPKVGYTWKTAPSYVAHARFDGSGVIKPGDFEFESPASSEVILNTNKLFPRNPDDEKSSLVPASITHMALRLKYKDKTGKLYTLNAKTTCPLDAVFVGDGDTSRTSIDFVMNLRDPIIQALTGKVDPLRESLSPAEFVVTAETFILVSGSPTPIKLDDPFEIKVIIRPSATATDTSILSMPPALP